MVGAGHRRYPMVCHDSQEEEEEEEQEKLQDSTPTAAGRSIYKADNSLRVWQYKAMWNQVAHAEQPQ